MEHPLEKTQKEMLKRKGKFFLMLPIILIPFFTLLFWSMGILGQPKTVMNGSQQKGINFSLPEAGPNADSN